MADAVKDAVGRVGQFLDKYEADFGNLIGGVKTKLTCCDLRTVLQALADAKAENERLQKDADMLRDCVMEFRNYAMSGKSFNYPPGSLQRIEHALKGTNP